MERRDWLRLIALSGLGPVFGFQLPGNPECLTTPDILGPFYLPNSPFITKIAPDGAPGTPFFISGTVYANDCQAALKDAVVDVWQANNGGQYESLFYRGQIRTGDNGQYAFQSVLPGKYLNGNQFRPRHVHYKVRYGVTELTTQIYFEGDTSIPIDPWASSPEAEDRIIALSPDETGALHGVADIYLNVEAPMINSAAEPDQPAKAHFIRYVAPNPIREDAKAGLVLARGGRVNLALYNLQGRVVNTFINDRLLGAGDHTINLNVRHDLGIRLPAGVYILALSMDKHPVDVKRVVIF